MSMKITLNKSCNTDKKILEALKKAASQLDKLILSHGLTEEKLAKEFRTLRKKKKDLTE